MTQDELRNWFAYHPGTPEQTEACIRVRSAMYRAAETFREAVPDGPGQRVALIAFKAVMQAMIGEIVAPLPK